jgi:endonuclease/exonuclease/phosphatase family metal-dependent hydrolase
MPRSTRIPKVAIAAVAATAPLFASAAQSHAALRVMTWNTEGAFPRPQRLTYNPGWANVIGNQKPDVAGLQEVCRTGTAKRIVDDVKRKYGIEYQPVFGLVGSVFACPQFGNLLLVKKGIPIAQSGRVIYRNQVAEGVRRGYAWANIRTAGGLVTVTSTHLQNGLENKGASVAARAKAVRKAQAAELAQGVGRGAARQIVVGDFNAGINGPELNALYAQKLADVDANCRAGKGCTPTQESGAKIDYILYRGFRAGGLAVHDSPSSDHKVVVANLG